MASWKVYGPRRHRRRWKIELRSPEGTRSHLSFESRAEAEAARQEALDEFARRSAAGRAAELFAEAEAAAAEAESIGLGRRSIGEAVDAWEVWRRARGKVSAVTLKTDRKKALALLAHAADTPVGRVTTAWARAAYRRRVAAGVAASTHQSELAVARRLWRWLESERWAARNPWVDVELVGEAQHGRAQLFSEQLRGLRDVALAQARGEGTGTGRLVAYRQLGALAVLVMLYLGPRPGEVVDRLLAAGVGPGRLEYVPKKQRRGRRRVLRVEVLEPLDSLLQARASECRRMGETRLFPHHIGWVLRHVKRLCEAAGVPAITSHGLRGSHATAAVAGGATMSAVSRQLGHASTAMTRGHYARLDNDGGRSRRVAAELDGGEAPSTSEDLARQIAKLQLELERARAREMAVHGGRQNDSIPSTTCETLEKT